MQRSISPGVQWRFKIYSVKPIAALFIFISFLATVPALRAEPMTAAVVRTVLNQPEPRLDFLAAAVTFDRLIDNNSDGSATRALVARLEDAARQMAGPKPSEAYKLAAVRQAI